MMILSQAQREKALNTVHTTRREKKSFDIPPECREFVQLADFESIEMPAVDGHPYKIHLAKAKNRTSQCPVHIYIHGGGWLAPHMENDFMWSAYLAHHIEGIVVDLDYTTTETASFPVALNQCYDATRWTFSHCTEWDAAPNNISIGGYSAGGNLAAAIAIKSVQTNDFTLCLQVLGYPPLDMKTPALYKPEAYDYVIPPSRGEAFDMLYFGRDATLAENPYVSPVYADDAVLAKAPRTVVISAEKCNFRFENEDFAERLASLGVEVTYQRFEGAVHGFIPHFFPRWEDAATLIVREILDAKPEEAQA